MDAVVDRHHAVDIEAVVERARALLDDGDVLAARLLAAGAYDQAKAAAGYAQRFGAAERLVGKARQLQGDSLLIETRAKIQISKEYDAAQASGEVASRGRPKNIPDGNVISQRDIGLTPKDIHEARKLAAAEDQAPGIVERAIAARLEAGLEPSRASLRANIGTKTATKEDRGHNLYETPIEAMRTLLALERFHSLPGVLEPACGKGAILRPLEDAGYDVAIADLVDYATVTRHGECQSVGDFLETGDSTGRDIVSNPPYGDVLNKFIAHALRVHRPRKMALLLNLNFLCGFDDPERCFAMDENPPARVIVFSRRLPMMHRDGWEGPRASSSMNTAWFIWELDRHGRYSGPAALSRVDWKDFQDRPSLPALTQKPARAKNTDLVEGLIAAVAAKAVASNSARKPVKKSSFASCLPPAPAKNAPVEFDVGGMKHGSSAGFAVRLNRDGTFALSGRYEISGFCGGASPFAGKIDSFERALTLGLAEVEKQLSDVIDAKSSVCTDRHRAAARAGVKWIAAKRAEWGIQ